MNSNLASRRVRNTGTVPLDTCFTIKSEARLRTSDDYISFFGEHKLWGRRYQSKFVFSFRRGYA